MEPICNQVTSHTAGRKTAPKILLLALSSLVAAAWCSGTGVRSPSHKPSEGEPRSQRLSDRELHTILNVAKLAAFDDARLATFADQAQKLYASTDYSEIQRSGLVPQIEKNSSYFVENSYDVVDARGNRIEESPPTEETLDGLRNGQLFLRQRPGGNNSLGLIKFELPNPYDVYLHGTPAQELFSRSRRDFSHGCVRVEDPVALAVWLLHENLGWNEERVDAAMHGDETLRIVLANPVPVWIVYGTAVVLEDGRVRFFKDVYGQDAALEQEPERVVAAVSE